MVCLVLVHLLILIMGLLLEVHNVFVDVTFFKTPKSLREKNVEFNEL